LVSAARRGGAVVASVIVLLSVGACSGGGGDRGIDGTFTFNSRFEGRQCDGRDEVDGRLDDLRDGTRVVVRDSEDKSVAVGRLERGTATNRNGLGGREPVYSTCRMQFTVSDVPDSDVYTIEIGNRGGLTFSKDELAEKEWRVTIFAGDLSG
jgi:hypothetical protein